MSERKNIIEVKKKLPKEDEISNESEEGMPKNEYGFGISPHRLEVIMGFYKERGNDFQDLKYLQEKGVEELISLLKTNTETGLDNLNGREEAYEYIANPILRERLTEATKAILDSDKTVYEIFGQDTIKVRSCMLLFASVSDIPEFKQLINRYNWR